MLLFLIGVRVAHPLPSLKKIDYDIYPRTPSTISQQRTICR